MDTQDNKKKKRFELVESEGGKIELVAGGEEEKEEERSEISGEFSQLLDHFAQELVEEKKEYTPIHVDEIASKLAGLYEKIRKVIDWKEDNALRRGAIERILKRVLFPKLAGLTADGLPAEELAETVAMELIRGGHLQNDAIPRERVEKAGLALKKYLFFLHEVDTGNRLDVKGRVNFATFVIDLAACEIEEVLTHPMKEYGVIKIMTELIDTRLKLVPADRLNPEEKKKQVFIAVCRTLYDLDDNFIMYRLLRIKYPHWRTPNEDEMKRLGEGLLSDWKGLGAEISQPIAKKFTAVAERVDTVFVLVDDVLEKLRASPKLIRESFEYKSKFIQLASEAYEKRHKTLKRRLFRLGAFSTLSVFLSNWVTFFLVEVPLAELFYEGFSWLATVVDFAIPTAVMFGLVSIIRPPKKDNIKKVLAVAMGFVYPDEGVEGYRIKLTQRATVVRMILGGIYVITIGLVFLGIAWVFYIANLPITSVIFDTFTIALTVFAAHTIKNKSRELNVDEHISGLDFLLDVVTLPVAKVGSFFAAKWKEYNIVAILFNFVIETPFAAILDFVQEWSEFLKERRAELH